MPVSEGRAESGSSSAEVLPFRKSGDSAQQAEEGIAVEELSEVPPELQELMAKAEAAKASDAASPAPDLELARPKPKARAAVDFVSKHEPGDPGPLSPAQAEQKLRELADSIGGSPLPFETEEGPVAGGRDSDALVDPHALDRLRKKQSREGQAIDTHQAEVTLEREGQSDDLPVIRSWMDQVRNIAPSQPDAAPKLEAALGRYQSMLSDHTLWIKQAEAQLAEADDSVRGRLAAQMAKEQTVHDHLTAAIRQVNEKMRQAVDEASSGSGQGLLGRLRGWFGGGK